MQQPELRTKVVLNERGNYGMSKEARRRIQLLWDSGWEKDSERDNPALVHVVEQMLNEVDSEQLPNETDAEYSKRTEGPNKPALLQPGYITSDLFIRDIPEGYERRNGKPPCYWRICNRSRGDDSCECLMLLSDKRALDQIREIFKSDYINKYMIDCVREVLEQNPPYATEDDY